MGNDELKKILEDKAKKFISTENDFPSENNTRDDFSVFNYENLQFNISCYDANELRRRNSQYTKLLDYYVQSYNKRQKINKGFKTIFFIIFMGAFLGILASTIIYIILLAFHITAIKTENIIGLITACSTLITSIIIIPKIIAKYLFSVEEDKFMADIIKSMLIQDDKTRNGINHFK